MSDQGFQSNTGKSFSAESFAVVFRKGQMVLDFKKTAPRIDNIGGDQSQTIVSEHQPVVMTPERAKAFKKILENNIENYEEKHGEIELPEREDSKDSEIEESQDYIG
ncbi:DUF3467 domain-containing protein [Nanohaloarchaea archaeon H01]|jgi:hypothetical protein|nr:DUF3467 domain-containing protein [Nanohaloarchaea archaeon H01]